MDDPEATAIGEVIGRFFRAVSFAPGERPDYEAIADLFVPNGLLVPSQGDPTVSTVREFVEARRRAFDAGDVSAFAERELGERTERFGNVAHRFSRYGKQATTSAGAIDTRGAISTQLVLTPDGWRITSMAWDDERPGLVLPDA